MGAAKSLLHSITEPERRHPPASRRKAPSSEEEVQHALFRLEGRHDERLRSATTAYERSSRPELRRSALAFRLRHSSSALDIVTGPQAHQNLLDLVALIELGRWSVEQSSFSLLGVTDLDPIRQAFQESTEDAWRVASRYLTPEHRKSLQSLLEDWKASHPTQAAISGYRLSELSTSPDASRQTERLFKNVRRALATADSSRLLAERAFYFLQRAPFLVRLHIRASVQEVWDETMTGLARVVGSRAFARSLMVYFGARLALRLLGRR